VDAADHGVMRPEKCYNLDTMKEPAMKCGRRTYVALMAAVAGLSLSAALPALAQNRIDTSGHALDANPQIGSGGYNAEQTNQPIGVQYQNALVTNNVTGGAGFRGRTFNGVNLGVGYTDPFAFRGLLAGQGVDQFISISTGVPTMANPTASSKAMAAPPTQYYGASNNNQPAGFQPLSNGTGYIPAQPMTQSPQDTRIGVVDFTPTTVLPKPDELLLPGPVDTTANTSSNNNSQVFAASPLYGMRMWQSNGALMQPSTDQTQNQGSNLFAGQSPLQQGAGLPQINQAADQTRLIGIRQELNNASQAGAGASLLAPLQPGNSTNANPNQALQPLAIGSAQLSSANLAPEAGDVSTMQSTRQVLNNIPLPSPTQQSSQYAALQQTMQKYDASHQQTDEQANRTFQQILKLRQQASVNAELGSNVLAAPRAGAASGATGNVPGIPNPETGAVATPGVGSLPNGNGGNPANQVFSAQSNANVPSQEMPAAAPPVPIDSYATGIKAKGLADLIADGEAFVQRQQYDRAIAADNDAIQVAPNNPLILMARANAELGGGYYAQAYTDLHTAIAQDPAVLIGQYDLQKHLGAQRLKALTDDLKQIVQDSPNDATHSFLYTYVLYNSHHIGMAAEWLNATDKRSGGQDPATVQMKKYWNFEEEAPAAQQPATRPSVSAPHAAP
jgi:tetratricopeptide (TPR) repeat protein